MLAGIRCACVFCLVVLASFTVGCGGGGGGGAQPLPPVADFSISISPASLSVRQGAFVGEFLGNSSVITSLSATNLSKSGQSPDIPIQGVPSLIEDTDASNFFCARANRGVSFLDAAVTVQSLPQNAPTFASVPAVQPALRSLWWRQISRRIQNCASGHRIQSTPQPLAPASYKRARWLTRRVGQRI
jgi:hypothetical protein